MENTQKQLLDAFVTNPTTYTISVRKNSMLPSELKRKKELSFTIKPPTAHTLALAAAELSSVPEEMIQGTDVDIKEAMKYQEDIARVISIFSHEGNDYPDWYVEFILKNVSSIDLLKIMQETAVKCNPGFFLNCIQVAGQMNPMMIRKKKTETSIPISS